MTTPKDRLNKCTENRWQKDILLKLLLTTLRANTKQLRQNK